MGFVDHTTRYARELRVDPISKYLHLIMVQSVLTTCVIISLVVDKSMITLYPLVFALLTFAIVKLWVVRIVWKNQKNHHTIT